MTLKTIDNDIDMCKIYAQFWMASALTGTCKNRKMYHGFKGAEFTDEEKVSDAMATALNHIHMMSELIDKKKRLISEMEGNSPI